MLIPLALDLAMSFCSSLKHNVRLIGDLSTFSSGFAAMDFHLSLSFDIWCFNFICLKTFSNFPCDFWSIDTLRVLFNVSALSCFSSTELGFHSMIGITFYGLYISKCIDRPLLCISSKAAICNTNIPYRHYFISLLKAQAAPCYNPAQLQSLWACRHLSSKAVERSPSFSPSLLVFQIRKPLKVKHIDLLCSLVSSALENIPCTLEKTVCCVTQRSVHLLVASGL